MKHTLKVTIALIIFFFMAQFIGLLIVNHYIDHKKTIETKEIAFKPLPYGIERPSVKNQSTSFIWVTIMILIGTLAVLLLINLNKPLIFKIWFFIGIWFALAIALAAFMNDIVAAILALIVSILRLYKPNVIVHNISEIFVYGGLVAFVVNIFNLFAAFMLLVLISIYDYVSVYKTKHMIKLAKFQSESKVFAGLLIPYEKGEIKPIRKIKQKKVSEMSERERCTRVRVLANKSSSRKSVAILGGGDIGFTLIFAGVVMKGLMLHESVLIGFLKTLIIPFFVSLALLILLIKGQENKFYPAMPFLSLGCFLGYLAVLIV